MDPIAAARYGMMVAAQRFEGAAGRAAPVGISDAPGAADAVADMLQAKRQFGAHVKTLRIADAMWRALIDMQGKAG
jgi:hypothetical protein